MYAQLKDGRRLPVCSATTNHVTVVLDGSQQTLRKNKVARFIGSKNMSHETFDTLATLRREMSRGG